MPCGHSIHDKCYNQYTRTSYKCPICNKSLRNMESHFRNLDVAIACQPMPEEYRDSRAVVLCNDCSSRSSVPYHFLGLKCAICRSYNTRSLRVMGRPGNEQELDEQRLADALGRHSPEAAAAAAGDEHGSSIVQAANLLLGLENATSGTATPMAIAFRNADTAASRAALDGSQTTSPLDQDDSDDDIIGFWGPHSDLEQVTVPSLCEASSLWVDSEGGSSDGQEVAFDGPESEDDDDDLFLFGHR